MLEKEELKPLPFLPQHPGPADLSYREEGLVKEKSGSSLGMLAKVPHLGALKKVLLSNCDSLCRCPWPAEALDKMDHGP